MRYTVTRIRNDYLAKLAALAEREHRSGMKELEFLIDERIKELDNRAEFQRGLHK